MVRAAPYYGTLPIFGVDVVPPAQVPVERLADLGPRAVPGPGAVRIVLVVREALRVAKDRAKHVLVRPRITLASIVELPALVLHAAAGPGLHGVSYPLVLIVAKTPFLPRALLEGRRRFRLLGGYGGDGREAEEAPRHRCRAVPSLGHRANLGFLVK